MPPGKDAESNWLPAPDGPLYIVMRLYRPKESALKGTRKPPALQHVLGLALRDDDNEARRASCRHLDDAPTGPADEADLISPEPWAASIAQAAKDVRKGASWLIPGRSGAAGLTPHR